MNEDALSELMSRYVAGDADAFQELYALVSRPLYHYLLRLSGTAETAEDLLQITFLKAHRARRSFVVGARPMPWLYTIAHRVFLDEARRKKRARVRVAAEGEELPPIATNLQGQPEDQVEEAAYDRDEVDEVLAALKTLPDNQREALVLTKLSGKSLVEAAEIAGTTPGAMKLRAHRGYTALRKRLKRREEFA